MTPKEYQVLLHFGSLIPDELQAEAMMGMERFLRSKGLPVEVFKDIMGDDSKLRRSMTPEERAKL